MYWADPVALHTPLRFPHEYGAHPETLTEWWYITGWLKDATGSVLGMQMPFFSQPASCAGAESQRVCAQAVAFCARSAERSGCRSFTARPALVTGWIRSRCRFGEQTTDVHIDDWSLRLMGERYQAHIAARCRVSPSISSVRNRFCCRDRTVSAAKARCRARRAATTVSPISWSAGTSFRQGVHATCPGAPGSTMSGRTTTWRRRRRGGIRSGSIWMTAPR